ncbi:MAG: hypothetical protein WC941_01840 [Candidatus Bathyarchaeia archaeon]
MTRVTGYDDPFVYVEHEGVDWCYNPVDGVFINLKRDRIEEPPAEVKAAATRCLADREALPDVEDLLRQAGWTLLEGKTNTVRFKVKAVIMIRGLFGLTATERK